MSSLYCAEPGTNVYIKNNFWTNVQIFLLSYKVDQKLFRLQAFIVTPNLIWLLSI
jgi:hypothetical protein